MRVSPVRPLQDPRVTDGDRRARPPLTGLGGGRAPCEARRRGRHGVGLRKAASSGAVHFSLVLGPAVRTLRVAPSPLRPERRGARLVGRNATVRVSWRPALSAAEDQRRPEVRRWQTQRVEMRAVSPKHNGRTSGREGPRASGSCSWAERKPSGPSQRQAPVPLLRGARLPSLSPPPPAAGSWAVSLTQAEGSSLPAARAGVTGCLGLAAPSGDPALHRGRASRAARWPPSRRGDGSGAGHLCLWPPLQIKFYWHAATPVSLVSLSIFVLRGQR